MQRIEGLFSFNLVRASDPAPAGPTASRSPLTPPEPPGASGRAEPAADRPRTPAVAAPRANPPGAFDPGTDVLAAGYGFAETPRALTPGQVALDLTQRALDLTDAFGTNSNNSGLPLLLALARNDVPSGALRAPSELLPTEGAALGAGVPTLQSALDGAIDLIKIDPSMVPHFESAIRGLANLFARVDIGELPERARAPLAGLIGKVEEAATVLARAGDWIAPTGQRAAGPPITSTPVGANDDSEAVRALVRRDDAANTLADNAYRIAPLAVGGDFLVEGVPFAVVTPPSNASTRSIWSAGFERVALWHETERFVLNLDDWMGELSGLRAQFVANPVPDLKQVLVVKDGDVFNLF